jgi:glyoxylase-like metal-dependent hydrolase (beta-lactamase superfamily II)
MTFFLKIESKEAFIIDPVLNYDPFSSRVHPLHANALIQFVENHGLNVSKIIDTHVHAVSFPTFILL